MTFPVGSAISQSLIRRFHQNDLLPISLPQKAISYQIKPLERLVGFKRVTIKAGDHQTVSIPLEVARMRYWDETTHAFVAEPGTYQIMAGSSSTDLPLSASFSVGN